MSLDTNQTSNEAVMRVSTDNGATFGPTLKLAANGTIGAEEPQEGNKIRHVIFHLLIVAFLFPFP